MVEERRQQLEVDVRAEVDAHPGAHRGHGHLDDDEDREAHAEQGGEEEGGIRSSLQPIQLRSKTEQMKEQEAKQEEEMTRFLQEFDGIDEVIREEVH